MEKIIMKFEKIRKDGYVQDAVMLALVQPALENGIQIPETFQQTYKLNGTHDFLKQIVG